MDDGFPPFKLRQETYIDVYTIFVPEEKLPLLTYPERLGNIE